MVAEEMVSTPSRAARLAGVDKTPKAELRPRGSVCQCASCLFFFTGLAPFDRHLIHHNNGVVSCRTFPQMMELGMSQNRNGVWQYGKSGKELRGE